MISITNRRIGHLLFTTATVAATVIVGNAGAYAQTGSLGSGSLGSGSLDFGSLGGGNALPYANTGWVTLHGDSANRKQQLGVTPSDEYTRWTALEGASILTLPVLLPNGNIAVTTGKAEGHANLHVLDRMGNTVWESPRWNGKD